MLTEHSQYREVRESAARAPDESAKQCQVPIFARLRRSFEGSYCGPAREMMRRFTNRSRLRTVQRASHN